MIVEIYEDKLLLENEKTHYVVTFMNKQSVKFKICYVFQKSMYTVTFNNIVNSLLIIPTSKEVRELLVLDKETNEVFSMPFSPDQTEWLVFWNKQNFSKVQPWEKEKQI